MVRLSKTDSTSVSQFSDFVPSSIHKIEACRAANAEAEKKAELQKKLVSDAEKLVNNAIKDVASLLGRVAVAGTRKKELLSSVSAALS